MVFVDILTQKYRNFREFERSLVELNGPKYIRKPSTTQNFARIAIARPSGMPLP